MPENSKDYPLITLDVELEAGSGKIIILPDRGVSVVTLAKYP